MIERLWIKSISIPCDQENKTLSSVEIGAKILIEMEVVFIVKSSLTLLLHILNDIFSNYYTFKQTYLLQVNLFFLLY